MYFSRLEEDLNKSFVWAQFFFIFPYKWCRGNLVLDSCLACGYGFMILLAITYPPFCIYVMVDEGALDVVSTAQLGIFAWLSASIVAMPLLRRSDLKSLIEELISLEKDLCRFGLAVKPKRSERLVILAALSIAVVVTYDMVSSVDGGHNLTILKTSAAYFRLCATAAEGNLAIGFINAARHIFTLLNASAHRPTQINAYRIDALSDLHSRAVHVCRKVNDVFSTYLALLFLTTLSVVTTSSYGILLQIKHNDFSRLPVDIFWMLNYFFLTTRVIQVFSETEKEAARFRYTLCHHLEKGVGTNSMAYLNYKLTIDRLSFTAKGFVDIHPSILLTILSCAVTYLIILID